MVRLCIKPGDPLIVLDHNGSIKNPKRWFQVSYTAETTIYQFANFLRSINTSMDQNLVDGIVDNYYVFMWNNCWSHRNALIYNLDGFSAPESERKPDYCGFSVKFTLRNYDYRNYSWAVTG